MHYWHGNSTSPRAVLFFAVFSTASVQEVVVDAAAPQLLAFYFVCRLSVVQKTVFTKFWWKKNRLQFRNDLFSDFRKKFGLKTSVNCIFFSLRSTLRTLLSKIQLINPLNELKLQGNIYNCLTAVANISSSTVARWHCHETDLLDEIKIT